MRYCGIKKILGLRRIAKKALVYIGTLPTGTQISVREAAKAACDCEFSRDGDRVDDIELEDKEWFIIDELVRKRAKQHGLELDDSEYYMQIVGMPYNIPFVVRKRRQGRKKTGGSL